MCWIWSGKLPISAFWFFILFNQWIVIVATKLKSLSIQTEQLPVTIFCGDTLPTPQHAKSKCATTDSNTWAAHQCVSMDSATCLAAIVIRIASVAMMVMLLKLSKRDTACVCQMCDDLRIRQYISVNKIIESIQFTVFQWISVCRITI